MTLGHGAPDLPSTFQAARQLLRWRPLGSLGQALRALKVTNYGGTPRDVDAAVPVVADVLLGAYLDLPDSNVPVTPALLERWGVSFETVLDAAGAHVPDRMLARTAATQIGAASYLHEAPLAAAALLRPGLIGALRGIRNPLALVPTQAHLILADGDDPEAVDQALRLVLEAVNTEQARLVSRTPLRLTAHGWEPVTLPDTPFTRAVRHLFDAGIYGEARDLVKAAHDRMGVMDVIMPAYQVFTRPEGGTVSRTSLTDTPGLRTFLPLADEVVLARDAGITVVGMDALRAIEGLARPVPSLQPPYLEVRRFPTELIIDAPAAAPAPSGRAVNVTNQGVFVDGSPITSSNQSAEPSAGRWDHRPVAGPTLVFDTPEFAYAVIEELMYIQGVLTPKFDVFDFAASQDEDLGDLYEASTIIPSVRDWFLKLPIPSTLGAHVEALLLDGGTAIQHQLAPAWHGEDDQFAIRSLTAAELAQFPNLKTINDNGFLAPAARQTVEAAGITIV